MKCFFFATSPRPCWLNFNKRISLASFACDFAFLQHGRQNLCIFFRRIDSKPLIVNPCPCGNLGTLIRPNNADRKNDIGQEQGLLTPYCIIPIFSSIFFILTQGSLRFRSNATLAQIIHSLFCTNASLQDATAYLVNGDTENGMFVCGIVFHSSKFLSHFPLILGLRSLFEKTD